MADLKYSTMPFAAPLTGAELTCFSQSGVSVQSTLQAIAEFVGDVSFNYGDGIAYDSGTNTVSADINTTNLQFTATQINTIQNIDLTASPTFETATLTSTTAGFLMPRMTTVAFDAIALPENGLVAWSQSSNRFRVNKGFPGSPDYDELAYVSSIPLDTTAFGEVYFQGNAVETVISAIGIPAKVDAVYNAGDLLNFTNGSGLLTYTGLETKEFAINLSLTTTLNLSTADISVVIFVNGSPLAKTEQGTFTGSTTPGFQSTSVNALVELSTGDIVEVYVKNNTSTDNIIVQDLNLNVPTIGGAIGNLADQVVTSWNLSTDSVGVTAGTDIDITGGVISYTGGGGSGAESGNFTIGTCLIPRTAYSAGGVYTSIIDQLDGTQTIAPISLAVGESIKLRCTFELFPTIPTSASVSGSFQYVFGGTILNPPPSANLILTNSGTRSGWLEYTVTRTSINEVTLDVTGFYNQTSPVTMLALISTQALLTSTTLPYDENLSYLVDVQWSRVSGDATNYLDVTPYNLVIEQMTSRQGAGGTQVVESWNGGTAPTDVTAGTNMSIAGGVVSTTAEPNVVTSVEGSSLPVALSAGTNVSITAGVISSTGGGNSNYTLLATCTEARGVFTPYTSGSFETVWVTLVGTGSNTIDPIQLGETIQLSCMGTLSSVTTGGTGALRCSLGGVFTVTSPTITSFNGTSIQRDMEVCIRITNVDGANIVVSVTGSYFDPSNNNRSWQMILNPYQIPYTGLVEDLLLEWQPTVGAGNSFNFTAKSLTIERLYFL